MWEANSRQGHGTRTADTVAELVYEEKITDQEGVFHRRGGNAEGLDEKDFQEQRDEQRIEHHAAVFTEETAAALFRFSLLLLLFGLLLLRHLSRSG